MTVALLRHGWPARALETQASNTRVGCPTAPPVRHRDAITMQAIDIFFTVGGLPEKVLSQNSGT
jgi:hypothetical protein